MTGVLQTYDLNRTKKRALMTDGAFKEVLYEGKILNKIEEDEKILLYRNDDG